MKILLKVIACVGFTACLLACVGCKEKAKSENVKSAENAGSDSKAKLKAIRQAGYPATLAELDAWYAEPPAGQNGTAAYQEAFAALSSDTNNLLKSNSKALQLLHQAATGKKCRYPVDLHQGIAATMPYLAKSKRSAQLLVEAAKAQDAGGRTDLAVQTITDAWLLARSLEDEPTLISQLVRIADEYLARRALEESLSRKAFSEAQLAALKDAWGDSDGLEGFTRALVGERAMGIGVFELPPEKQAKLMALSEDGPKNFSAEAYRKSSEYDADLSFYLDRMEELLAATAMPFPNCLEAASRSSDRAKEAKGKGFHVSAFMLPALSLVMERAGEAVGYRRATLAGLAVERYRLAHQNALPDTLDQLVPQFLPAVPTDPFDGKPLRYAKKSPTGYVIYSIGRDRKDDGGEPRAPGGGSSYDVAFSVRR